MADMWGNTDIRLRTGTQTVAGMTSTYAVSAFPVQSDQGDQPWFIVSDGRVVPAALRIGLDNSAKEVGGIIYEWRWGMLTPDMFDYVRTTYLDSGWSGEVTIRDWNRLSGSYEVYNCKAVLSHPEGQDMNGGGWTNYLMSFYELAEAAAS